MSRPRAFLSAKAPHLSTCRNLHRASDGNRVRGQKGQAAALLAQQLLTRRQEVTALLVSAALVAAPAAVAQDCTPEAIPSGIKYCELSEGTGKTAEDGQLIRAHYAGSLESTGKQFDNSFGRGAPLTFRVGAGEVIKGWDRGILGTEGMPPMKEGGKRRLVIPPELGYGSRGVGKIIPPNSTLVFDVQFLGPAKGTR